MNRANRSRLADRFVHELFASQLGVAVQHLLGRVLHRPRADRLERAGDSRVARELAAADGVDDDPGAVGRVLNAEAQLEVHWHAAEAGALDADEADLVVLLER